MLPGATFRDTASSATNSPKRLVMEIVSIPSARGLVCLVSVMGRSSAATCDQRCTARALFDDAQFGGGADQGALGRRGDDHDQQGQDVGRRIEQVVALAH